MPVPNSERSFLTEASFHLDWFGCRYWMLSRMLVGISNGHSMIYACCDNISLLALLFCLMPFLFPAAII